ncbi:legumain-like [Apium graveolens]|uniref:legumain-like n=1 Tax=Apium graveolens TaxID=4045 RepID=UPI003D7A2210
MASLNEENNAYIFPGFGLGIIMSGTIRVHDDLLLAAYAVPLKLGLSDDKLLYAKDLIDVLKKKHKAGTYKEMVIYLEACESGSIFEDFLPNVMNIYVQTASNSIEDSYGAYCPKEFGPLPFKDHPPPREYRTCLGDFYSVSWMEDSETHNLKHESIEQQYQKVDIDILKSSS